MQTLITPCAWPDQSLGHLLLLVCVGVASSIAVAQPGPTADNRLPPHHAHVAAQQPHGTLSPLHGPPAIYLLVEQLRRGGLVLFIRHGKTQFDGKDSSGGVAADCNKQRGLSDAGKILASELGESFRRLAIPVGSVKASPMCRTLDTARLSFGQVTPETDLYVDPATLMAAGAALHRQVAAAANGGNTVLVGHLLSPMQAFHVKLDEGEALVIRPGRRGVAAEVLGRINAVQWGDLTRDWLAHGEKMFDFARHDLQAMQAMSPSVTATSKFGHVQPNAPTKQQ